MGDKKDNLARCKQQGCKCMRVVDEIRDWFNRWGEILAWVWRFDGVDEERNLDG